MCHHARLIFVFSVERGFHHIAQGGLELLTSSHYIYELPHPATWLIFEKFFGFGFVFWFLDFFFAFEMKSHFVA